MFDARDGTGIPIRLYRPKDVSSAGLPVMVVLHGGGWCIGDLDTEGFLCKLLCHRLNILIFNIAYRLYPDVKFPIPMTDIYDGVKWVTRSVERFGGDCSQGFIVGGNSGGATFASIIAHLARDDGITPKITGQFLACPILTDETEDRYGRYYHLFPGRYLSQDENWNAPLQDRVTKDRMREFSLPDPRSPLTTPFLFENHGRLPSVYTQVCGLDPWRDGGIIYNELVEQGGSKSKIDIYAGMPHCWWNPYPMVSRTEKWKEETVEGVRWLLEQSRVKGKIEAKL